MKPAIAFGRPWLAMALAAQCALLFAAGTLGDFTVPGNAMKFVTLMFCAGGSFVAALHLAERRAALQPGSFKANTLFWGIAILCRIAMLGCEPGDDIWRYLWEGRIQIEGANPYLLNPAAPELAPWRDVNWPRINHPDFAAVYPPATEFLFKGIAFFSPTVLAFKLVFVAADLLTIALLVRLCANGLADAAWYAWNPAVIYAFAGGGHYDSVMLLGMTASLLVLHRATRGGAAPSWNAAVLSVFLLGLSIALKLVPVFLIPAWICALGKKSALLPMVIAIPAALALPFGGIATVLRPLNYFADIARFNEPFWWLVESVTYHFAHNTQFTVALCCAVLIASFQLRHDWRRGALWSMGLTLFFSPVLHPWYATWILPLACWRRAHPWSIFSISAISGLLLWETTHFWTQWEPNAVTRLLFLLPPLLAWRMTRQAPNLPHPSTIQ